MQAVCSMSLSLSIDLFLPVLLFTLAAGPLRIAINIDETTSEDYFFAVCHLEQFWSGLAIDELYDFATAFGAFAGFAIYNDWFHNYYNFMSSLFFLIVE